ncbi:uncharacterized protein MONBRDRAFT_28624 [Monosiga brevicollis MX1]|uniref:PPM-type phosphatase domain-containing protein n=1 Tax=Monosiga brevicollis TaxID=81824 RepID=A9V8Q2_MONBE|nr:uncharacterized protein MONBRDRAFT_28624 [Monosiga brevicollis MX1]EDQ86182.1 predicted protein [Monosiga brevicollis MX1]|eukprot:XP_001749107.1 hypothetical protein [Monosiga brevicollis MX1]
MGQAAARELKKPVRDTERALLNGLHGPHIALGACGIQGYRRNMEDAHILNNDLLEDGSGLVLIACLDGHGGRAAALSAAHDLPQKVAAALRQVSDRSALTDDALEQLMIDACKSTDHDLPSHIPNFRTVEDMEDPGSTCVGALLLEDRLVVFNIGDSRAVLAQAIDSPDALLATRDHKPQTPSERQRIEAAGGFVAGNRVCQSLAVSRAFGDFSFKDPNIKPEEHMVTCIPDITIVPRNENLEFIILACDGVWDVLRSETVVGMVREELLSEAALDAVCQTVVMDALQRGSSDNISCCILTLDGAKRSTDVGGMIDDMFVFGDETGETASPPAEQSPVTPRAAASKPKLDPKPVVAPGTPGSRPTLKVNHMSPLEASTASPRKSRQRASVRDNVFGTDQNVTPVAATVPPPVAVSPGALSEDDEEPSTPVDQMFTPSVALVDTPSPHGSKLTTSSSVPPAGPQQPNSTEDTPKPESRSALETLADQAAEASPMKTSMNSEPSSEPTSVVSHIAPDSAPEPQHKAEKSGEPERGSQAAAEEEEEVKLPVSADLKRLKKMTVVSRKASGKVGRSRGSVRNVFDLQDGDVGEEEV